MAIARDPAREGKPAVMAMRVDFSDGRMRRITPEWAERVLSPEDREYLEAIRIAADNLLGDGGIFRGIVREEIERRLGPPHSHLMTIEEREDIAEQLSESFKGDSDG